MQASESSQGKYRVGMVARMTGLSTHALRMWEKRYAAVVPKRTEAGGRLYSDQDVERLRMLRRLVDAGHSIGSIANLPEKQLKNMAGAFPAAAPAPGESRYEDVRSTLMRHIEALRMDEAEQLLSQIALATEPRDFIQEIIGPTMVEVGDRWESGTLRIVHEHACSAMMRSLLSSLKRLYPANASGRSAVVTTPAHERHELGALMAAMFAAMHGWRVLYLGPDLPAEEIVYATGQANAELLLLSVVGLPKKDSAKEIRKIENALGSRVTLIVGGRGTELPAGSRAKLCSELADLEPFLLR